MNRFIIKNFSPKVRNYLLNFVVTLLFILVFYLSYFFIEHNFIRPPTDSTDMDKVIQVDVLNGCGVSGIAVKFTEYLRARGFDVLEMGNYKSFEVEASIVIDRVGNQKMQKKLPMHWELTIKILFNK